MVMEDRLSQLPDDVLVSILSQLTMREVVLTSCLSSQWRYLWMHVTRLEFNRPKLRWYNTIDRNEASRYINWVSHVLGLHKSSILEELNVYTFASEVDKWLKIALSKKVERLRIELFWLDWLEDRPNNDCLDLKRFHNLVSTSSPREFGLKNLKVLTLREVDVDNEVVKVLLSSCPLLEDLSILKSNRLQQVEIGPSLKLKHLKLWFCRITCLKIDESRNLVSFSYGGKEINLGPRNVPTVVDIHITACSFPSLTGFVTLLATKFTQLIRLHLEVDLFQIFSDMEFNSLPKFSNLKQLILVVDCVHDINLHGIRLLLNAFPALREFEIELKWGNTTFNDKHELGLDKDCHYQHIKVIRYRGYLGCSSDMELMSLFVKSCLVLEKLIVSPCDLSSKVERRSRSRAWRQLEYIVPQTVELVIL